MTSEARTPIGVLLMAYGSPNSLAEVAPYYTDVRGGHAPSAEQLAVVYDHYARVGGATGLLEISEAQVAGLQARLDADAPGAWRVYLGMRHWRPYIADAVRKMAEDGVREAVGIALAPHDSRISVGGYIASVEAALATLAPEHDRPGRQPDASGAEPAINFSYVRSWHTEPHFLRMLAERITSARNGKFAPEERDAVHVIFTAHSLPQRVLTWNDPYPAQLRETVAGVTQLLGLDETRWTRAYQSAGRTAEPWLGPSLLEAIPELAARGVRSALVCPIGFVADNLEILYDIDVESREFAARQGIHLERIAMPNADPLLIEALANVTRTAIRAGATPLATRG
ncbi:MAG TPA: ferrochelatase [Ktedonobacterales bacterium]|jgi:ferrochelatase|nr:ferrochelatase [Ktedonobacterales bacterium]